MVKVMEIGYNTVEFDNGDSVEIVDGVLYVNNGFDVVGVFAAGQWIRASVVEDAEETEEEVVNLTKSPGREILEVLEQYKKNFGEWRA